MASGRLGSAKLQPYQSVLLYSNTSGRPAAVNVQATTLDSTANGQIGLAIDSASVTLNQTTTATTIASGSVTSYMNWLDPLSNNRPTQLEQVNPSNSSNTNEYPVSYWDGSAWTKPSTGYYGAQNWQKIDPYFLRNPAAYGKSKAALPIQYRSSTTVNNMRWRYYNDASTFTGTQFANGQQFVDPGSTNYSYTYDNTYDGYGAAADPYTDWAISVNASSYMRVWKANDGSQNATTTTQAIIYNLAGTNTISSYSHFWYSPRIMGSNGLFIVQPTGYSNPFFSICDPDLAISMGSVQYAIRYDSTANAANWTISLSGNNALISWFEYNPNTGRYYFECIGSGYKNIYSVSRTDLRALPNRGNTQSYDLSNAVFTNHGAPAWGTTGYSFRPMRIGQSLWWTTNSNGSAYVSTDLITWVLATTYFPANGYPANTFNVAIVNDTQYLYSQTGTANISKFDSGYYNVSQNAVLEYNTSFNNYQRTGLALSAGDKIYAQNYGTKAMSVIAMGFEE